MLDKPWEGIPPPVIGWLHAALNNGGDTSSVPQPAKAWVDFILKRSQEDGMRAPDEVPFGLGLPKFGGGTPMPTAPGQGGTGLPGQSLIDLLSGENADRAGILEQLKQVS